MKWISVSFAKPLPYQTVLFVAHEHAEIVGCGQYLGDDKWQDGLRIDAYGDPADAYNVTHWMPLPEPPAVEARATAQEANNAH